MLIIDGVSHMGKDVAPLDLPCDQAQFLFLGLGRGIEQQAMVVIAMWHKEAPPLAPQFYMDHGHPDGV